MDGLSSLTVLASAVTSTTDAKDREKEKEKNLQLINLDDDCLPPTNTQLRRVLSQSGMPNLTPIFGRSGSAPGPLGPGPPGTQFSMAPEQNWRAYVAIEERSAVREKIRQAYRRNCTTYEQLLETVCGIDEEIIYAGSVTRMDYFKSSIDWDNRILIKNKQLRGLVGVGLQNRTEGDGNNSNNGSPESEERSDKKRKTDEPTDHGVPRNTRSDVTQPTTQ